MGRILLIDDDNSLREVVQFILTESGHEVLTAGDGREGLGTAGTRPRPGDHAISGCRDSTAWRSCAASATGTTRRPRRSSC